MSVKILTKFLSKGTQMQLPRKFSSIKLSEEHVTLQKITRRFADKELKPIADQLDREKRFPIEKVHDLAHMGLMSITVSEKWGGAGNDMLALAIAVEEISRGCASTGAIVSIHNCLYADLLNSFGTDKQKKNFLIPFTKGGIGCFSLSEPDAGSDVSAMNTSAHLEGDCFILNGTKSWVTSAPESKAAAIFATVDKGLGHKGITAFLVPLPFEGVTLGKFDDKLGIRAASTCNLILENVCVPKENVLGEVGEGFKIAMMQLDKARIGIAAQAIGIGQAALELAVNYATQRKAFGKPISEMQAVKLRIANMAVALESAKLLVHRAAILCDQPEKSTKESSMAKLAASEAATFIAHNTIQILGAMGFVTDMPAERHYRDARVTEIYGGISDIQKLIIADSIFKEYGNILK